jgi:glycosyltransferase involved in cell wall biosynthesis
MMHFNPSTKITSSKSSGNGFLDRLLYIDQNLFLPKSQYEAADLLKGWVPTRGVRSRKTNSPLHLKFSGKCAAEEWSFSGSRLHHLIPGKRYAFSGMLRVESIEQGSTFFKIELWRNGVWVENLNTDDYDLSRLKQWQKLSCEFTAPEGETSSLRIYVEKRPFGVRIAARLHMKEVKISLQEQPNGLRPTANGTSANKAFPFVTIIIPVYNSESTLRLCLNSIRDLNYPADRYETIIVDNGSTDSSLEIAARFAVTIVNEHQIKGSYAARNKGIAIANGDIIAFTDSDCIVDNNWLTNLLSNYQDQSIGCFAGSISTYSPSSILEIFSEREGILKQSGALDHPYLPFAQTANAAYRKSVFDQIGLFIPEMKSGGDAEIAWRMQKQLGLKIHFDTRAVVFHKHRNSLHELGRQFRKYEQGRNSLQQLYPDLQLESAHAARQRLHALLRSSFTNLGQKILLYLRREIDAVELATPFIWAYVTYHELQEKTAVTKQGGTLLQLTPYPPQWANGSSKKVVLVIAPRLPEHDRASGDLRLFRLIKMLSEDFCIIYFNDLMWERFLPAGDNRYLRALSDLGIYVVNSRSQVCKVLEAVRVDIVLCEFHHLWSKYRETVTRYCPGAVSIVDSVDVHFLREALMGETLKDPALVETARRTKKDELIAYHSADFVWVVSEPDRAGLIANGFPQEKIHIVPNIHLSQEHVPPLECRRRNSLLFIGGFQHQPNVDGTLFFLRDIFPLVAAEVPDLQLTVVGDSPPPEIVAAASAAGGAIDVVGYVPETKPYLDAACVSIAPLRYGAGLKGKVGEALSHGLPLVSTSIGTQGMNLCSGEDCFIADNAADFASAIIQILKSPELWNKFSLNGRRFMSETFGQEQVKKDVIAFLKDLDEPISSVRHPKVSIVYLTKNGGELFKKSLDAVFLQKVPFDFEVLVVDSGSTDGTLEFLSDLPVKVHEIRPQQFNFGLTRDLGFTLAKGEIVIAISQDAVPVGDEWLVSMVDPFSDPEIAVVQCNDVLPPNERIFYWHDVGLLYFTKDCKKWMDNYHLGLSFTCCAIRRSVWKECPIGYSEMSEDKVFQKRVADKGHKIVKSQKAKDFHHHDYDVTSLAKRCQNEGMGWRNVGIEYNVGDLLTDIFDRRVFISMVLGICRFRINKISELLFPIIRPLFVFIGNQRTSKYVR